MSKVTRDKLGRFATGVLNEIRSNDGSLPTFAWPGGYPLYYLTRDGLTICPVCANDPDTSDPVVAYDTNWEDPALFCDDKGGRIESAYAEDDADPLTPIAIHKVVDSITHAVNGCPCTALDD